MCSSSAACEPDKDFYNGFCSSEAPSVQPKSKNLGWVAAVVIFALIAILILLVVYVRRYHNDKYNMVVQRLQGKQETPIDRINMMRQTSKSSVPSRRGSAASSAVNAPLSDLSQVVIGEQPVSRPKPVKSLKDFALRANAQRPVPEDDSEAQVHGDSHSHSPALDSISQSGLSTKPAPPPHGLPGIKRPSEPGIVVPERHHTSSPLSATSVASIKTASEAPGSPSLGQSQTSRKKITLKKNTVSPLAEEPAGPASLPPRLPPRTPFPDSSDQ